MTGRGRVCSRSTCVHVRLYAAVMTSVNDCTQITSGRERYIPTSWLTSSD